MPPPPSQVNSSSARDPTTTQTSAGKSSINRSMSVNHGAMWVAESSLSSPASSCHRNRAPTRSNESIVNCSQKASQISTATSQPQTSNSSEPPPIPVRRIPPSTQSLLSSSPSSSSDHHHHNRHHQSMLVKSDSISEKNVLQLCSEGFERVNVLNALARTNNNLCLARRLLSEAGCGTRA